VSSLEKVTYRNNTQYIAAVVQQMMIKTTI